MEKTPRETAGEPPRRAGGGHVRAVTIDDVELVLTRPVEQDVAWIGQEDLVEQILASWLLVAEKDLPLCPRLLGKPGVGKTTLAYHAARAAGLPAYIQQCTVDTRPEDLLVTPVLSRGGTIAYHASPLVSAMVEGGAVILDEANRMSEKSWASLAPLLDHRRYVESVVAGVRIPAHPAFRACITMNEDASTYEIPDYMLSRLQPAVQVEFPEREEELRILRYHLPFAPDEVLALTVDFLQGGHAHGLDYSTRDGINIVRYALKKRERGGKQAAPVKEHFEDAVRRILGKDAMDFKKHSLRKDGPALMDLREFFAMVEGLGAEEEGKKKDRKKDDGGEKGRKKPGRPGDPDEPGAPGRD
jgi:hypothetical protein